MVSVLSLWLLACVSNAKRFTIGQGELDAQELGEEGREDTGRRCFEVVHILEDAANGHQIQAEPLHERILRNDSHIDVPYGQLSPLVLGEWTQETMGKVLCKGSRWTVDFCPAPCRKGHDCFARKSKVVPACLELADQHELSNVPATRGPVDNYFMYQKGHKVQPTELPLEDQQRATDEVPCPVSPGIYRSAKCDNRKDAEMQGINHFEIPPGKGMCADKQCYHVDDLADLAQRAYEGLGVFKIPHSGRTELQPYELRELGLDTQREERLLLRWGDGCQWVPRMQRMKELRPFSGECVGPMVSLEDLKAGAADGDGPAADEALARDASEA